mgnify:CR=1 FL=1
MGWFHNLGNKVKGTVHTLGNKIHKAGTKAAKFVHQVAPKIESIATTIADDAGIVGEAATSGIERVSAGAKGDAKKFGRGVISKAAERSRQGGALTKDDLKGVAGGVASGAFNRFVGF